MLKKYLLHLYTEAMRFNDENVTELLGEYGPFYTILDVGCWDGKKTLEYAKSAQAVKVYGIEVVSSQAKEAQERGIDTVSILADREKWPFDDSSIDCVISNQVIEHLSDIDFFISEAYRVLKKGGYIVTSTNNLSSWHNIFAIVMGWTPFDLTNSSKKGIGIGNPLALHQGEVASNGDSWTHKTILNTRWINSWLSLYGFTPLKHKGAGYYPFFAKVGSILRLHSAFVTLINRKNEK